MKKNMWLVAGIAGMLLGTSGADAKAEFSIRLGDIRIDAGDRPAFVIESRPSFVYLEDQGFSVSMNSPYDIVFYDDLYYLYNEGIWYSSSDYSGPWLVIQEYDLPYNIRRHRWEDIRRYRDFEYRRHDHSYWEERDRHDRERYERERLDRGRERARQNDNGPRGNQDQRRDDNRGNNRGNDNRKAPDQPKNSTLFRAPDQPNRDANMRKGPDQPNRDANMRKGPDQPKSSSLFKAPEQPKKDANIKKASDQPRKDSKKDDKENNPNH